MSHFTKVQTKITDLDCLKQALEDLQYHPAERVRCGYGAGAGNGVKLTSWPISGDPTISAFVNRPRGITKWWPIGGAWRCEPVSPK